MNGYLAPLSETYNSSFLDELWQSIEEVVKVRVACTCTGGERYKERKRRFGYARAWHTALNAKLGDEK